MDEFQCGQCGAVYDVVVERLDRAIRDEPICAVCGKVMSDTVGNLVRRYTLKQVPSRKASDPYTG